MVFITRTHRGRLSFVRQPDALIPPDQLTTFEHACDAFAFLIERGERVTALDWCERIASTYAPGPRVERVMRAIQSALIDRGATIDGDTMSKPTNLDAYAAAGYRGEPNPHLYSSPAWFAHAIGAHMNAKGMPAPTDVRMGRGFTVRVRELQFREIAGQRFERIE